MTLNMRGVATIFLVMLCLACALSLARAQTTQAQVDSEKPLLHPLFNDHMVLQRSVRFPVWGWTTPGSRVTVEMRGREATAVADARGKWLARLGPFDAGGPFTLTVKGPRTVTLNDVLVGDVWLASGQSNMEMGVTQVNDAQEEVARANYPRIRLFQIPKVAATSPRETVNARWLVCNPTNVAAGGWGGFSAVAYFFGRRLHKELNVPVGLIHSSWGGTAAEGWVSPEALSTLKEFAPALNELEKTWAEATRPPAEYDKALDEWWSMNDPGSADGRMWSEPSLDASGWKRMRLPQFWEDAGLAGFDGVVWFRRTFELPSDWAGRDLLLSLGPIDDRDTTFVNGVRVGSLSQWDAPRAYRVSASLLKPGENTIAVRVLDTGVGGGVHGKPEQMRIEPLDGSRMAPISLAGEWSYRVSVALAELKTQPPQQGGNDFSVPVIRYNGMIAPLLPYAIKGAIWYQGETNVGRAAQYERVMATLIRDWRERFGVGDFPFLIVQLASFLERRDAPADSEWARLREAQSHVSRNVARSGLAVTIDIGDAKDIHPKNKQDVGERLALVALARVYGRKLEYSGPTYRSMRVEGERVRLSFEHASGGLVAKGGGRLAGFTVAGDDGRFVWADAEVEGEQVIVSSPEVKRPVAVRYAWADNPEVNLYNRAGLPASPFRTDDFPPGATRRDVSAQSVQTARAVEEPEEHPKDVSNTFQRIASLSLNGYEVSRREKKVRYVYPREANQPPDTFDATYAILKRRGRVLMTFDGVYSVFRNATDFGPFPFLGGGTRQLAVSLTIPRGGRHWVVDLSSTRPRVIFDSATYEVGREELSVIDIDRDGTYEISMPLTVFYMFENMSMAETPLPEIVFKYDPKARRYMPANRLFPDYALRRVEEDIKALKPDEETYLSKRLDILLRYVYAGREREGWDFFDKAYARADHAALKRKIKAELRRQPLYRLLYRDAFTSNSDLKRKGREKVSERD